jgi:hypothetical protein
LKFAPKIFPGDFSSSLPLFTNTIEFISFLTLSIYNFPFQDKSKFEKKKVLFYHTFWRKMSSFLLEDLILQ